MAFGRLGSAMVGDAISAGRAGMAYEQFETGAPVREMAATKAENALSVDAYDKQQAGSDAAYAKVLSEREELKRNQAQTLQKLKVEKARAEIGKISAMKSYYAFKTIVSSGSKGSGMTRVNLTNASGRP